MTGKSQRHQKSSTNILNISSSNRVNPIKETFLLTRKIIFEINEELKKRAIVINSNLDSSFSDSFDEIDKYIYANKILYVRRNVPLKAKEGFDCLIVRAHNYHSETKDILLTASYYLKNIIILQALEDGNHRTAITATKLFLYENGYTTREMLMDASDKVEKNVDAYGYKIYHDNVNFWDLEDSRGHTKKVKYIESKDDFSKFKNDLIMLRDDRYPSASAIELKPIENTIENPVFKYCFDFITDKLLVK